MTHISVTVDGTAYEDEVEPRLLLVHYLRLLHPGHAHGRA